MSIPSQYPDCLHCAEDQQLEPVKQNGDSIRFIHNPSEKVQLEALKNGWFPPCFMITDGVISIFDETISE